MMKINEIVIISGKGGTGKTTLTASLIPLLKDPVIADCDVDAPDLHLLLDPLPVTGEEFIGGSRAFIDPARCTSCGRCVDACRFSAISPEFTVKRTGCEGCGVCEYLCPVSAVTLKPVPAGEIFTSATSWGPFIHARLYPGEETSGKLVARVRNKARETAKASGRNLILSDGSPGIGCSVISSLTGASLAVLVTEPTVSGLHDLERVLSLCSRLNVPAGMVINKHDLYPEMSKKIESFGKTAGIPLLMKIPFSSEIVETIRRREIPRLSHGNFFRIAGIPGFGIPF